MPSRVVRQPNGLLAVFSTIVDDFTVVDATETEMREYFRDEIGVREGNAKVDRGLLDDMRGIGEITKRDGLNRWRDALETLEGVHGKRLARERAESGERAVDAEPEPVEWCI